MGAEVRRTQRHHDAAKIKEINHSTFKEKDKEWVKCTVCLEWLWEETYYKVDWYVGPTGYYPHHYSLSHNTPTHRICTACCSTPLAVVDYLDELKASNKVAYNKSMKAWQKKEKAKDKEALTIVDGKQYSFTFKEVKEK